MATKIERVAFRLSADLKAAIARAAEADHRTMSSMVEKILSDWLEGGPANPHTAAVDVEAPRRIRRPTAAADFKQRAATI